MSVLNPPIAEPLELAPQLVVERVQEVELQQLIDLRYQLLHCHYYDYCHHSSSFLITINHVVIFIT